MGTTLDLTPQRTSVLLSPLAQIVILSVLAAALFGVCVPRVLKQDLSSSAKPLVEKRMDAVSSALESFEQKAGRYPTTYEGLHALLEKPATLSESFWGGPYLHELPKDPWQQELVYVAFGENGRDYDLISPGPDRALGTRDDISRSAAQRTI